MNIHVLDQDAENRSVQVVFHLPVPPGNNAAGTPWKTAVQRSLNPVPSMPWNATVENAAITAGEVLEVVETVVFSSKTRNNAQRLAEIQAAYTARQADQLAALAVKLNFFGYEV